MQREIKFRAWNKKRKRMYSVLHLHLESVDSTFATVKGFSVREYKDIHINIQPKDIILMQYTGLKDCKGKEIYEGDIYSKGNVVEFSFGSFNINGDVPLGAICSKIEIIGNVYENPELE